MECIICRTDKEDMSDEHVIPESLGGYYHIFNVCVTCNSNMGRFVDAPLINHKLTELYRFCKDIVGKKGRVPNPFSGIYTNESNSQSKARFDINSEGKLVLSTHPIITTIESEGEITGFEIEVDSKDEHKIEQIFSKILKRHGISDHSVIKGEQFRKTEAGPYKAQWIMDSYKFKIGLLKIAYEFSVDSIDGYYNDEDAIFISEILKSGNCELIERYVKGSGLNHSAFDGFSDFLDLSSNKHYLLLMNSPSGLSCLIKLHDCFSVGVILSKKNYPIPHSALFGINDIEGKSFRKLDLWSAVQECYQLKRSSEFRFATRREAASAIKEKESSGYLYERTSNDYIPLYKRNGEKFPFLLHGLLEICNADESRKNGILTSHFHFPSNDNYYIKSLISGRLYRVVGFDIERDIVKKI